MDVIRARNINHAYRLGANLIGTKGVLRETRNGPALVAPYPVSTLYEKPTERVLFDARRDANPFFHFFESLWILAGRNDVDWLRRYNSRIADYSDDGKTFYGAYGHRLRNAFGPDGDQIVQGIELLRNNPNTRQVVLGIWDPENDMFEETKDVPCNLNIKLEIVDDRLNMTVFNRSNDMIWGAYGANAVHFSYLQEYIAGHLGVDVGWYIQVSGNFHAYLDTWRKTGLENDYMFPGTFDDYEINKIKPFAPLMQDPRAWDEELKLFTDQIATGADVDTFTEPFFAEVAVPLYDAWEFWLDKDMDDAIAAAGQCHAEDWSVAAVEWLKRRIK